jgi:hypothetical protein
MSTLQDQTCRLGMVAELPQMYKYSVGCTFSLGLPMIPYNIHLHDFFPSSLPMDPTIQRTNSAKLYSSSSLSAPTVEYYPLHPAAQVRP